MKAFNVYLDGKFSSTIYADDLSEAKKLARKLYPVRLYAGLTFVEA